jgi:hypothetical protein
MIIMEREMEIEISILRLLAENRLSRDEQKKCLMNILDVLDSKGFNITEYLLQVCEVKVEYDDLLRMFKN